MSGGIADTLAAHEAIYHSGYFTGEPDYFTCDGCDWRSDDEQNNYREQWAAHQAEVLSSAGYGELSALLDDLRALADQWQAWPEDDPVTRPWDGKILARIVDRHTPARKDS